MIRVGVVGCGEWGLTIARRLKALRSRYSIAWLEDLDPDRESRAARSLSGSDANLPLSDEEVGGITDAVVLAVPPSGETSDDLRLELLNRFLHVGIKKFRIEKPCAFNRGQMDALDHLETVAGLEVSFGFQMLYDRCVETLEHLIGDSEIVRFEAIRVGTTQRSSLHPILDLSVHDIAIAHRLGIELGPTSGKPWERVGAVGFTSGRFTSISGVAGRSRRVIRVLTSDAEIEWDQLARSVSVDGKIVFSASAMMDPLGLELIEWSKGKTLGVREAALISSDALTALWRLRL